MHFFSQFLQSLLVILIFFTSPLTSFRHPGLFVPRQINPNALKTPQPKFTAYYYNQTLDHFNYRPESYKKFSQRYAIDETHWGGPKNNSPIFVNMGSEMSLEQEISASGFIIENAPSFGALIVFIEHRFYGQSNPLGTMEEALKKENADMRGYFNSAQALADYAEIILHLKKELSAQHCPVIVFGGSYGGNLAAWMRLKYPHVAYGALASSAPVLFHVKSLDTYFEVATKDFRDTSENCYRTIKKSWSEIDKIGSQPNGLSILAKKLKACSAPKSLKEFKENIRDLYAIAAQYDMPPDYPVTKICKAIDGAPKGANVIDKIAAALLAIADTNCVDVNPALDPESEGFRWQSCSELMADAIRVTRNDSMFYYDPRSLKEFSIECMKRYGVFTRTNWIIQYYGENDIELVLEKFGSNIIFSNGLRDPLSALGVLKNLSDTIVAVYTKEGSHTLDQAYSDKTDPIWLTEWRKKQIVILKEWLVKYYIDLRAYLNRKKF